MIDASDFKQYIFSLLFLSDFRFMGLGAWSGIKACWREYGFQQHIIKSLKPYSGCRITLSPHEVLCRNFEVEMHKKTTNNDLVDAVIELGKNLFYNSTMENIYSVLQ